MQKAVIVQCVSFDAESDFISLNNYLHSGWKFVSATPLGVVGSSKVDSLSDGYLSVMVIIENDNIPDVRHL